MADLSRKESVRVASTPTSRSEYREVIGGWLESGRLKALVLTLIVLLALASSPIEAQESPERAPVIVEGARNAIEGARVPAVLDLRTFEPGDRWQVTVRSADFSTAHDECLGSEMGQWRSVPDTGYPLHEFHASFTHEIYASADCSFGQYVFVLYWMFPTGTNRFQIHSTQSGVFEIHPRFAFQSSLGVSVSADQTTIVEGGSVALTATASGAEGAIYFADNSGTIWEMEPGTPSNSTEQFTPSREARGMTESSGTLYAVDRGNSAGLYTIDVSGESVSAVRTLAVTDLSALATMGSNFYAHGERGVGEEFFRFQTSGTVQSFDVTSEPNRDYFVRGMEVHNGTLYMNRRRNDNAQNAIWSIANPDGTPSDTRVGNYPAGVSSPRALVSDGTNLYASNSAATPDNFWEVDLDTPSDSMLLGNVPSGVDDVIHAAAYVPAVVTYSWTSSGGGTFSSTTSRTPNWTSPSVSSQTDFTITGTAHSGGSSASDTVTIRVSPGNQPPGVPGTPSATTLDSDSILVYWNAPQSGGDVATYELRYAGTGVPGGTLTGITGTSRTVNNLEPGTEYTFDVRARNQHGVSAWSSTDTATTGAAAPDTPDAPTVTSISESRLSVTWTEPDDNGAAIDYYNLRHREQDSDPWTNVTNIGGMSHTITHLQPGETLKAQVRAHNSAGLSGWSATGEGTTEFPSLDDIAIAGSSWLTDRPGIQLLDRSGGSTANVGYRWRLMPDPDPILLDNADVESRWYVELYADATSADPTSTSVTEAATGVGHSFSCGGSSFVESDDVDACPGNSSEMLAAVRLVFTAEVRNSSSGETFRSPYSVTWHNEPTEPGVGSEDHWTDQAPEVSADYSNGRLTLVIKHPPGPGATQILLNNELPIVRFDAPHATGTSATSTVFEHTPPAHSVRYYLTADEADREWISFRARGVIFAPHDLEIAVKGRDTKSRIPQGRYAYTQWTRETDVAIGREDDVTASVPGLLQTPVPADPRMAGFARNLLEIGSEVSGGEPADVSDDQVRQVLILLALLIAIGGGIAIAVLTKVGGGLVLEGVASGTAFAATMWAGVGYLAMQVPLTYAVAPLIIPVLAVAVVVKVRYF